VESGVPKTCAISASLPSFLLTSVIISSFQPIVFPIFFTNILLHYTNKKTNCKQTVSHTKLVFFTVVHNDFYWSLSTCSPLPSFLSAVTALPCVLEVNYILSQFWESFRGSEVYTRKPAS
jgi:hypothetical protein